MHKALRHTNGGVNETMNLCGMGNLLKLILPNEVTP